MSRLHYNQIFTVWLTSVMINVYVWSYSSVYSCTTHVSPSTTKKISSYNSSWKLQLSVCETSSAADGSVWLLWPPWPLETYINPSSLTGFSVFKVQVEGCLPSQPVVLNFHIPHWEVCKFNVHEHTQTYVCPHSKWIMACEKEGGEASTKHNVCPSLLMSRRSCRSLSNQSPPFPTRLCQEPFFTLAQDPSPPIPNNLSVLIKQKC